MEGAAAVRRGAPYGEPWVAEPLAGTEPWNRAQRSLLGGLVAPSWHGPS